VCRAATPCPVKRVSTWCGAGAGVVAGGGQPAQAQSQGRSGPAAPRRSWRRPPAASASTKCGRSGGDEGWRWRLLAYGGTTPTAQSCHRSTDDHRARQFYVTAANGFARRGRHRKPEAGQPRLPSWPITPHTPRMWPRFDQPGRTRQNGRQRAGETRGHLPMPRTPSWLAPSCRPPCTARGDNRASRAKSALHSGRTTIDAGYPHRQCLTPPNTSR